MSRSVLVAVFLCASVFVHAQNVLSSETLMGSVTGATVSGHDVWTRGGSPRTGYYYYWKPVTLQSTNDSIGVPYNQSTGLIWSRGTYYLPAYTASGVGSTSFTNNASEAIFSFNVYGGVSALPVLPAHEWASDTLTANPRFYFSVPNDTDVTITFSGKTQAGSNLYALSGEIAPSESGLANTVTVTAGGTYCFWATMAVNGTTTGNQSPSFGFRMKFVPVGG